MTFVTQINTDFYDSLALLLTNEHTFVCHFDVVVGSVFHMLALFLLTLLLVHTACLTPEKQIYFRIITT